MSATKFRDPYASTSTSRYLRNTRHQTASASNNRPSAVPSGEVAGKTNLDPAACWIKVVIGLVELVLENWVSSTAETDAIMDSLRKLFHRDHPVQSVISNRYSKSHEKLMCIHSILVLEQKGEKMESGNSKAYWYSYNLKELGAIIDVISKLFRGKDKKSYENLRESSANVTSAASTIGSVMGSTAGSFSANSSAYNLPVISPPSSPNNLPLPPSEPVTQPLKLHLKVATGSSVATVDSKRKRQPSPLPSDNTSASDCVSYDPPASPSRTVVPVTRIFRSWSSRWNVQWTDEHQGGKNVSPGDMSKGGSKERASRVGLVVNGVRDLLSRLKRPNEYNAVLRE